MRIKKLLTEALIIDKFGLTKEEKYAIQYLHQKFGNTSSWALSFNKMVDMLEDVLGFSFTVSAKLAKIYINYRDFIFKEINEKYFSMDETEIIYEFLSKYLSSDRYENEFKKKFEDVIKKSHLADLYGDDSFYTSIFTNTYSNSIIFYVVFEPTKIGDVSLTALESRNLKWKAMFQVDFRKLESMVKQKQNIGKEIPFNLTIRDIEYNFPIPELEGSTDEFTIPFDLDIDNLNFNDIQKLVFDQKNSIVNYVLDIIKEINTHLNIQS